MAHGIRKRDRAIVGLLMGKTVEQAAQYAGVGKRTLDRWLADHDFRQRLDEARQAVFERHIAALSELSGVGIRRIRQILDNDQAKPGDWLRATEIIFKEARNSEAAAIRQELDEIHSLLSTQGTE